MTVTICVVDVFQRLCLETDAGSDPRFAQDGARMRWVFLNFLARMLGFDCSLVPASTWRL